MYRIALVQNQSEMAHYGYADGRQLLGELGYHVRLFTAHDIGALISDLDSYDALFLASNALGDQRLREVFTGGARIEALDAFLRSGRGLLCGHELGLAQDSVSLEFLPPELGTIVPRVRPPGEQPATGRIAIPEPAREHFLLQYPDLVDPAALQRTCLAFKSLPGVYWHYWDNVDYGHWDVLLEDALTGRALVVASKQSLPYNVVLSAIPFDWQRQFALLRNFLRFVAEGSPAVAVLVDPDRHSREVAYLTATLEASGVAVAKYTVSGGESDFDRHMAKPIHSSLVIGPGVDVAALDESVALHLHERLRRGDLRILSAAEHPDFGSGFSCFGRGSIAREILSQKLPTVMTTMDRGYIDGSFWATAETLQVLEEHPLPLLALAEHIKPTLRILDDHERDGSYDATFGASCAAYWLRATYQGRGHEQTQKVAAWLRDRIDRYDDREQIYCLSVFAQVGEIHERERERLRARLRSQLAGNAPQLSLINYIRGALSINDIDLACEFQGMLCRLLRDEEWLDMATAADACIVTIALLAAISGSSAPPSFDAREAQQLVSNSIVDIRNHYERQMKRVPNDPRPWERKLSTTVKCLQAWRLFDESLLGTVNDALAILKAGAAETSDRTVAQTALSVLGDLKSENERLKAEIFGVRLQLARAFSGSLVRPVVAVVGALLYLLVSVIVGASLSQSPGLGNVLEVGFVDAWGFHFALISIGAALLSVPWERWRGRDRSGHDKPLPEPPGPGKGVSQPARGRRAASPYQR
jgi:hypothetical protein